MSAWISAELTSLAFLWRLDRCDGVTMGFTSHDHPLWFDWLEYRAAPGMTPSAIEWNDGFDAESVELSGVLTSDAIRDEDLSAGRWDGTRLRLWAVDWTSPDTEPLLLASGTLGAVEQAGARFSVELRGASTSLDRPVVEATSPECRASLGDRRCRVDLAGRRRIVSISAADGNQLTLSTAISIGDFGQGRIRILDGANAGLSMMIVANDTHGIALAEAFPAQILAGTRAEIVEGCDRRFATCVARFANASNFRGEPHLPGNDLLTRYAG